ncbi:MAG: thioredoxin family protein [Myxococcales bacterium]
MFQLVASLVLAATAAHPEGLPFIEDDYPAAAARAKSEHKPIVSDTWATWCHTCLSMKRYVFPDPGLRPVKDAAVWLSIDSENPKNKEFLDKFPLDAWPTFLVIDPDDGSVLGRWVGSATPNEFRSFVQKGVEALHGKANTSPAETLMRKGYEARGQRDYVAAAAAYGEALDVTPKGDPARPERLVLLASALAKQKSEESARKCVALGLAEMNATGNSAVATDFAAVVSGCADALPKDDPQAAQLRSASQRRIEALLKDREAPLSVDDRSDAMASLVEIYDEAGRHKEAVAIARKRVALLEGAAKKAPDQTMASTFDAHRVDAYLYLGEPKKAEALLSERERQMPGDYNPPARLARVYFEQKKFPEAEKSVDRALGKMTRGQRQISVLGLKAKILAAQGKPTGDVIREQLAIFRELPQTQQNPDTERSLTKALAEAEKTAASR